MMPGQAPLAPDCPTPPPDSIQTKEPCSNYTCRKGGPHDELGTGLYMIVVTYCLKRSAI